MDMDKAAVFLAASILITLAGVIIVIGLVLVNYILNKYWKPVTIFSVDSWTLFSQSTSQHYVDNHPEMIAARNRELDNIPTLTDTNKGKKNERTMGRKVQAKQD